MVKAKWNKIEISSTHAVFKNTADYSIDVHEGQDRWDGTRMPARPWMEAAISEVDIPSTFYLNYNGDLGEAFEITAQMLHDQMKQNIIDERWAWDRQTQRKNGYVADSPRDIYDTGHLFQSQQPPSFSGGMTL